MIAVSVKPADHEVVQEFFQLFKTPWEFYRVGCQCDVLICSHEQKPAVDAKLVLVYGASRAEFDEEYNLERHALCPNAVLSYAGARIPIYGECATFSNRGACLVTDEITGQPAMSEVCSGTHKSVRIGFDLFYEIRYLLQTGQPAAHAAIPALDLHVSLLRDLILRSSISLVEIPPVPAGFNFIACLTHDIDHFGIRNHKFDHTMLGFLYRAIVGSVAKTCQGRLSLTQLATNWLAAFSLPFIYLGMAKDFWCQLNRYVEMESGAMSTFFVIPAKADTGKDSHGRSPSKRAASYDLAQITPDLHQLQSAGREIGLHGIDAWRDSPKGCNERDSISHITGRKEVGVRMHWLFFNEKSPATLESAGFSYDSTVGYNETVGYRAGTSQVYKPLGLERMLELPMHIMDTALFYPAHMNLSPKQAKAAVAPFLDNAVSRGGVLTVNWHDRSIAPERLWGDFYVNLLDDLKRTGAWFPTASQAVTWFRKRRSASFRNLPREGKQIKVSLPAGHDKLPGLRIRLHQPKAQDESRPAYTEISLNDSEEIVVNSL